jgi:hypothetical protein
MLNSVNRATLAAVVKTATYQKTGTNTWNRIKYTTEDAHNFNVGQSVTVTGITGGTSANVSDLTIVSIPTPNSFIVSADTGLTFATGTSPVIGTGSSAVTAWATNSWTNLSDVNYATPEPSNVAPYYIDITNNIRAVAVSPYPTDGTVSVILNWSAIGGSNPLAHHSVTQTLGTTTTTLLPDTAAVSSTTVTGLTADSVYTFGITSTNIVGTRSNTVQIAVPRFISNVPTITATATALTAQSVTVSWTAPVTASPVVLRYELFSAFSSDNISWSSWTEVSTTIPGTTTSHIHSSLAKNTYYKYRVRAFNGSYTDYTESTSVLPLYIDVTPNIQASALAYPTNGTVSVGLTWTTAGTANPGVLYDIFNNTVSTTSAIATGLPANSNLTVTGLTADVAYTFRAKAINSVGETSATTVITVPNFVSNVGTVTAAPVASTPNTILVSWIAPTIASPVITAYEVQRAESTNNYATWTTLQATSATVTSTSYTDTTAATAVTYQYRVRAFNTGLSNYTTSNTMQAYYITDPMVTPNVTTDPAGTKNLIISVPSYVSNPAVTDWTIQRSTTGTNGWGTVATTSTLPYTNTTVDLSTTYYYRIRGTNGQVTSAYSSASVGVTTYSTPNAPTNVVATPSLSIPYQIDISWTSATVVAGSPVITNYVLERSTDNATWSVVNSAISPSATSYSDTGRSLSVQYWYRVSAVNSVGTGTPSTSDDATITLINDSAIAISVGGTTTYNTGATISVTSAASRSVTLQVSTDNSNFSDVETKTSNGSGATSFVYNITQGTNAYTYFRVRFAQDGLYFQATTGSVSTRTTNNSLTITATYAGWYPSNGSYLTQVRVTDGQGRPVSGAVVDWYYKQYGISNSYTGYSNTTDSNGYANYFWNSSVSRLIYTGSYAGNYTSASTGYIHVEYIQQYVSIAQSGYYSWAEAFGWNARQPLDGYMYSGYWSSTQKRQVSAAWFSSGYWGSINDAYAIDDVKIDITRKGGTGSSAMNIAYGVHASPGATSNVDSMSYTPIIMWGATNAPAYSSGNNRDYGTSLYAMKDYFKGSTRGLFFGYKSQASTTGNYAVLNNNIQLYIWWRSNPYA